MYQFLFSSPIEFSAESSDSPGVLSGYAVKYNVQSVDRGGYRAVFKPGAFANLKEQGDLDIKAYRDHDNTVYLGRTNNGSLKLKSDSLGVRFELTLPNTQDGRDTAELARNNHFGGMSFGYHPDVYSWKKDEDGTPLQVHSSGLMREVSVVYDPAIPGTELQLHALTEPDAQTLDSLKEFLGSPRRNSAFRELQLRNFE